MSEVALFKKKKKPCPYQAQQILRYCESQTTIRVAISPVFLGGSWISVSWPTETWELATLQAATSAAPQLNIVQISPTLNWGTSAQDQSLASVHRGPSLLTDLSGIHWPACWGEWPLPVCVLEGEWTGTCQKTRSSAHVTVPPLRFRLALRGGTAYERDKELCPG